MTITQPKRQSKAEQFFGEAPDAKPAPKLRGKRQPFAVSLPPDLVKEVDRRAALEDRSRAKMIELVLRRWVQETDA
jgi:hypothetical protein